MNVTSNMNDTSLEKMFQRMGTLLKDIAAERTGLADDIAQNPLLRSKEPGLGENFDLTALKWDPPTVGTKLNLSA
jgi:hypothetical protein